MIIYLNSKSLDVSNALVLSSLLEEKQLISKKGIAVAINNSLIQKAKWAHTILKENDKIIVISATKGG
ncbi:MAG: sulfur carrier protein ThiS [Bacteroidales bacterium]|jgi:sulfur carrier protein|nr:sulfur carrier protein ThiS [Bacteroidales bacterium]